MCSSYPPPSTIVISFEGVHQMRWGNFSHLQNLKWGQNHPRMYSWSTQLNIWLWRPSSVLSQYLTVQIGWNFYPKLPMKVRSELILQIVSPHSGSLCISDVLLLPPSASAISFEGVYQMTWGNLSHLHILNWGKNAPKNIPHTLYLFNWFIMICTSSVYY